MDSFHYWPTFHTGNTVCAIAVLMILIIDANIAIWIDMENFDIAFNVLFAVWLTVF